MVGSVVEQISATLSADSSECYVDVEEEYLCCSEASSYVASSEDIAAIVFSVTFLTGIIQVCLKDFIYIYILLLAFSNFSIFR